MSRLKSSFEKVADTITTLDQLQATIADILLDEEKTLSPFQLDSLEKAMSNLALARLILFRTTRINP